jgi:hypothetical protein
MTVTVTGESETAMATAAADAAIQAGPEQAGRQEPDLAAVSTQLRSPAAAELLSAAPQPFEAASNPWTPLLSAGLKLLEALAAAPSANGDGNGEEKAGATTGPWIETDAETGRPYLRLPLPEPKVVQQLSGALSRLLVGLGGK